MLVKSLSGISCLFFYPDMSILLVGEYHDNHDMCKKCEKNCFTMIEYINLLSKKTKFNLFIEDLIKFREPLLGGSIVECRQHFRNDNISNLDYFAWDLRSAYYKQSIRKHPIFILAIIISKNNNKKILKYDSQLKHNLRENIKLIFDWIYDPKKYTSGKKIIKKYFKILGLPYYKSYSKYNYFVSRSIKTNYFYLIKKNLILFYQKLPNTKDRLFIDIVNNIIPDINLYNMVKKYGDGEKNLVYGGRRHILALKYLLDKIDSLSPDIEKDVIEKNIESQCVRFKKKSSLL